MKVILRKKKNYHPLRLNLKNGDAVDLPDKVAKRWIAEGIAYPIKKEDLKVCFDRVSIVILVKDALTYFKKCLESVVKYTRNYELIIIDNGSGSLTKKYLTESQSKFGFILITNNRNKGFAYGCNQGIKVATCDYICFLNSDTVVTRNWLSKLMEGLRFLHAGVVGPSSCWVASKQMLNKYVKQRYRMTEMQMNTLELSEGYEEVDLVGFCLLVKKEVLEKVGGFDHNAFPIALGEDRDFIRRIQKSGYKTYWIKNCYVHHYGSATIFESRIDCIALTQKAKIVLKQKENADIFIENNVRIENVKRVDIKTDVIIVTLDRQEETTRTLKALFKNNENINVTIIDNGSDDLDYLKEFNVKVIRNKNNRGVSKAFNQGIKLAYSKYIVLMHNDIEVNTGDWIKKAISFMEENEYVGIIGQAGWNYIDKNAMYNIQSLRTSVETYQQKPEGFEEVAILDGCCNVMRNIGIVFDENLDYYYYDFDISMNYRTLGFRLYVMDGSSVHFACDRDKATVNLDKCRKSRPEENTHLRKSYQYFISKWGKLLPIKIENKT